jgi:hypothetical protein
MNEHARADATGSRGYLGRSRVSTGPRNGGLVCASSVPECHRNNSSPLSTFYPSFLPPTVVLSICQVTFSRKERSLSSAPAQLVNLAGLSYTVWCSSLSLGKSSLVIQFTENQFIESYYPTIESTHTKSVSYKGVDYDCDIIDTAGQVCVLS